MNKEKFQAIFAIISMMMATLIFFFSSDKVSEVTTITLVAALMGVATFPLMLSYLKVKKSSDESEYSVHSSFEINEIDRKLDRLRKQITEIESGSAGVDPGALEGIERRSTENVLQNVKDEILSVLQERYGEEIKKQLIVEQFQSEVNTTRRRLSTEIENMASRANINLIIGILTSIAAIGVLSFVVLTTELKTENVSEVIPGLVLRLSLVIFIEIFSFFFLKLYKQNINDIKYYQNEMTNIDMKLLALRIGNAKSKDGEIDNELLKIIANTERNFVLQKGETSVVHEAQRFDNETNKELFALLNEFVKSKKG